VAAGGGHQAAVGLFFPAALFSCFTGFLKTVVFIYNKNTGVRWAASWQHKA
jgi:hypothetical protein